MNRLIKNIRIILIAQLASRHIELQTNPHNWATRSPHPSDDDLNGSISRNDPSKIYLRWSFCLDIWINDLYIGIIKNTMKSLKSMVSMKLSLIIQNDARAMIIRNKTTADVHKMMQLLTKAILTHVIWVNMGENQLLNVKDLPITTLCNCIWQHRIHPCHLKVPKYLFHQLIVWNKHV